MRKLWMAAMAAGLLGAAAPPVHAQGTVPAGTAITVTLTDSVSSKDAKVGQRVRGSTSDAIVANGKTIIPKDSLVAMSVARVQPSGRLKGVAKLYLKINSIEVRGKTYDVSAHWAGRTGTSHKTRNVEAIGGGAAAGGIIGAIAGGGKGAAIGAAAGAGAGTAGAAMTGKKDVTFPSETKLRFTLKLPLTVK